MDVMREHIFQSNLIEGVTDPKEVTQSLIAWNDLKDQPELTMDVVLQTHRLIMQNHLSGTDLGALRTRWVVVGGRRCPDPAYVEELLIEWLGEMKELPMDPRQMHIWYERIHPFIDGNGRTGRMYMWWHEIKVGIEPTLINFQDRWDYYNWFDNWGTRSANI